jgi:hypothetical protein
MGTMRQHHEGEGNGAAGALVASGAASGEVDGEAAGEAHGDAPGEGASWRALSGARNRFTFCLALGLWFILTCFIVTQSVSNGDPFVFMDERGEGVFRQLDAARASLAFTEPSAIGCDLPEACLAALAAQPTRALAIFKEQPPKLDGGFAGREELRQMLVHMDIQTDGFKTPYTGVSAAVHLPRLRFQQADVLLDGHRERRFYSGERIMLGIDAYRLDQPVLKLDVMLRLTADDASAFVNWAEPAFLTDITGKEDYLAFLRKREADPVRQINAIVRVSMAVFALLLFLIIESSSEALGLALFMGFNTLSTLLGFEVLRLTWLPTTFDAALWEYFCNGMGEVARLYYFVHLSRAARPAAKRFFGLGLLYVVPFAVTLYLTLPNGWTWQRYLVGATEATVAITGLVLCARALREVGARKAFWRIGSLALAAAAAACQLLDIFWNYPLDAGILLGAPPVVGRMIHVVYTNSAYLLAMSMFTSISTLENRVRALTAAKVKAQTIEKELELGRSVQQAFMTMPALPRSLSVETFHEAALFVSGDTYYTHWNEEKSRFVCLLNDVTGHGVQAALKAFGCTVIARSVWRNLREGQLIGDRRNEERLSRYGEAIAALINNEGEERDFNAMLGVEFHTTTGEAKLYRVNYNNPLVVEPVADGAGGVRWRSRQLVVPNRSVTTCMLAPRSLLMLVSDGLLAHPRDQRSLLRYIDAALAGRSDGIGPAAAKALVLDWARSREARHVDDRTLIVFQWTPGAVLSEAA